MGRGALQVVLACAAACAVAAPAGAKPVGGSSHVAARHVAAARHGARSRTLDFSWPAEVTVTTPFTRYHHGLHRPATRAVSSVGTVAARQAGGHWFEPSTVHPRYRHG